VDTALAEADIQYDGGVVTKHLLNAMVEDIGFEEIRARVKRPLTGLRVAPYYGCQIVRPYGIEDDTDSPIMLDELPGAPGATPSYFPMKTICCGGSLMRTLVLIRSCVIFDRGRTNSSTSDFPLAPGAQQR
jgi:heterodisulfide reductase subunit B